MNAGSVVAPVEGERIQQYVSFRLGAEHYAVDINRIQEIKGWDCVTRVPRTPPYILGVVNLRGNIVPVIDLRMRFGFERIPYDASTVIVVVRTRAEHGERTVGVVVDAVSEVHDVATQRIQAPPRIAGMIDLNFLLGVVDVDDHLVILLDIEQLVSDSIAAS